MYENLMSLREVCALIGTTRSAVQGYEKLGLVKPVAVNKYGHLLYDESAVEKIALIYFLQRLYFTLKEIKEILNLPICDLTDVVKGRIATLRIKTQQYEKFLDCSEMIFSDCEKSNIEGKIMELLKKEI